MRSPWALPKGTNNSNINKRRISIPLILCNAVIIVVVEKQPDITLARKM